MGKTTVSDTITSTSDDATHAETVDEGKRDFIHIATGAVAAAGVASIAWPLVMQMSKASDTLAAGSIEIDLSKIPEGQQLKMLWRGMPVFVRHRTPSEIAEAENTDISDCPDPQTDDERLIADTDGKKNPAFLVMIGVCTHFGCVPVGEAGDFDGWYCPCHGSHYDTSGRIRKGPAPTNMEIPPYEYVSSNVIKVG
jgi:ubiquinol-cytochrome c reductase iron-sulfur subunit